MNIPKLVALCITLFFIFSCSRNEDFVKITDISPTNSHPLLIGDKVTFDVKVEYELASNDNGSISLIIQQKGAGKLPIGNDYDVVLKGKGTMVLSSEIVVPQTKAIQVFTPLLPEGTAQTQVVDMKMYKVVNPPKEDPNNEINI